MTENQELSQKRKGLERSAESVVEFCRNLVGFMQLDLELQVNEEDGVITVDLTGPDRPLLLSNTAALMNSMEYLLNRVFRGGKEDAPGVLLDSEQYRRHREAELTLLAQMAAKKAISLGKPLELQPMTPRERRIVHLALAGVEGVRSQSVGEGDNRSVTILPS